MTAEQLKKDTQNRLETIFHVRTRLDDLAEHKRQCIIASLLHAYDTSWQVESFPSLIGKSNSANNEEKTSAPSSNPKKDVAILKRWMIVMGVGYLTQGSNIGDSKKFVQLCTVLMDKVEQRHGSKLKPIIRQIIGKQGRLTVKNVAESQRQNLPLDSSTVSSNPDSEKNPFLGRSLPRSALEAPPAPGRDLPRTPLKKTDDNAQDLKETDPEIEQFKLPAKPKSQEVENSKPESYLTVPQKNTIPSGKDLARTPMAADKNQKNPREIEETCEYEVPTNFGADYSPRTPDVVSQRKVLPEDEPIVSKIATLIQKTEEESKKEQVLENMIPCGSKIIPRTPFHGGAALDKEETTEPQKSTQNSSQENKIKANFIPCGLNIPRTPFNGKDMTKSLEDADLQTDKTSTEVDIEVIAKEDEPTRKVSKVAKNVEYVEKTEEEPKKVEKQTSEKQSIKSSKAKKTAVRPRSKKNDEKLESNRETHDEKSAKITVTEIQDKAEDTKTSKKKDEKIKNNKTVELLSKSEEEMPKRRRSPRLIPTSNGANSLAIEETKVPLTTNDKTSSVAPSSQAQAMTEENKSSTTRQRLQRPTKAKDAEKDVKLPQIEDKSSTTTGKPATKRKSKKKASKAKMDVTFDVIEELVPPLKMAKGKDGGKPSERISDEVYSTPSVKKVGIAPRQRKKTKKLTAQIFSIEDEIFQTPKRKQK